MIPRILQSHYFKFDFLEETMDLETLEDSEFNEIMDSISSKENEEYPLNIEFSR